MHCTFRWIKVTIFGTDLPHIPLYILVESSYCYLSFCLHSSASNLLPYAAVGVAAGTAAVAATPLVLSAAGYTAGGATAGSVTAFIQSVYGGSVASGGAFAFLQSAGAAGIGTASRAAIGGITAGIAAYGARMFVSLNRSISPRSV